MTSALRFRNLEVSPDDPVEVWPVEAIATALDRGELPDWHRLAVVVEADPYGEVSQRLEEALKLVDSSGVRELMGQVLAEIRTEMARVERRQVADEIRHLVGTSRLSVAAFAASIGTSASRMSTYMNGKVTPSAALMLRIRERAQTSAPGGAGSPVAAAGAP